MDSVSVIFAVLFVIGFFLYQGNRRISKKAAFTLIPGPKPKSNAQGNEEEIKTCGSFHQFLVKYHRLHGPIFSFWFGQQMCVSIASGKLFQQHSAYFDRACQLFKGFIPLLGEDSIELANGDVARLRHAAYSKAFNPSSVKKFYDIFNKLGKGLIEKWSTPPGKRILVQEEMHLVAIKAILESLLGEELEDERLVQEVDEAFEYCWNETEKLLAGDRLAPGSEREAEFENKKQIFYGVVRKVVKNRKKQTVSKEDKLPIDTVFDLNLDDHMVVSDLVTLFGGGFLTTSSLLIWSVYRLAIHQDVQDKVRAEVRKVAGSNSEITHHMTEKLRYMKQVFKETMRTSLVSTMTARIHDSAVVLGGHTIPAQTPVIHAIGVSLQDEKVFSEPRKFDPDRFSPENERLLPPFSFEPFGFGGKRKCPGYNFSYSEATTILAHLIRAFRIELAYDQPVQPVFGLTTRIKDDLWVTVTSLD